jgi:hypothetical protein
VVQTIAYATLLARINHTPASKTIENKVG